jgi:hypothetical protein
MPGNMERTPVKKAGNGDVNGVGGCDDNSVHEDDVSDIGSGITEGHTGAEMSHTGHTGAWENGNFQNFGPGPST